jgi:hypothetical protein
MRSRYPSPPAVSPQTHAAPAKIPLKSLLRMSNTAPFPQTLASRDPDATTLASTRKPSDVLIETDHGTVGPVRSLPDFSIEGQNGLIKHHLLNDRRRVLTLDTAGEVVLWDLLQVSLHSVLLVPQPNLHSAHRSSHTARSTSRTSYLRLIPWIALLTGAPSTLG